MKPLTLFLNLALCLNVSAQKMEIIKERLFYTD